MLQHRRMVAWCSPRNISHPHCPEMVSFREEFYDPHHCPYHYCQGISFWHVEVDFAKYKIFTARFYKQRKSVETSFARSTSTLFAVIAPYYQNYLYI